MKKSSLMKFISIVFSLSLSPLSLTGVTRFSCGDSKGYAYYFEGGLVKKEMSVFHEDGITGGKFSLTLNDKNEADILAIDATGTIKSATSEGADVRAYPAGGAGFNWMAMYTDGTLEVYSWNATSNTVAAYRNTVGNPNIAKNSLFVSNCD